MTLDTPPRDDDDVNAVDEDDDIGDPTLEIVEVQELNEGEVESMFGNDDSESESDNEFTCPVISSKLTLTHKESVFSGHFSPNNELIATASQEDKAFIWNANTGELVFECSGYDDSVIEAKFNNSGTYVATGDMNGSVKVWKVETKTLHDENTAMGDEVSWLFWHPVTNVLFAGFKSGDSYMWRLPMTEFKILFGRGSENVCGALLPDGKRLAVGYKDGTVTVFDLKTSKEISSYKKRQGVSVTAIDCYSDNNLIAIGYEDEGIVIIKSTNGNEVAVLKKEEANTSNYTEAVKFGIGPASNILAAANGDEINFWDFARQTLRKSVKLPNEHPARIQWSKNGILYVAGVHKNKVYGIDGRSAEVITLFKEHNDSVLDICLSNDNQLLMSTSDDGTVKVYDISINSDSNSNRMDS